VKNIPLVPTVIVALAIAIMIALGVWQLGRADEKEAMLARYAAVSQEGPAIAYPAPDALEAMLYRPVTATCRNVQSIRGTAGTNAVGVKGWAQVAQCMLASGQQAEVAMGWSRAPDPPQWEGGEVTGILAPGGKIVADPALAGLGPLAKPDPADLPNNHLSYAVQWFLFALTALVIYILALRLKARR
jgi:cytochrome oxidase assembly protein ShyY1